MSNNYYDDLANRLTDPSIELGAPSEVKTDDAAATAGHAFLLGQYGSDEAIEAAMKTGRPAVGSEKGARSPVVRGSITPEDYRALHALMDRTGRTQAELVREAVHHLVHQKTAS